MEPTEVSVKLGEHQVSIQTGKLAKQANSVVVRQGDTMVLVTAVSNKEPRSEDVDFLPLTVDYVEKAFSAGKIPGGFFKREGRPTEREVLTSRLIDRPIRPLFPEGWICDVQVIATVLSADLIHDPQTLAIIGASAALTISEVPFSGPLAACRVSRVKGQLIINGTPDLLEEKDLDIVVAASQDAIVMVEGGAQEATEKDVLDAIMFAHQSLQPVIEAQEALRKKVGKEKRSFSPPTRDAALVEAVKKVALSDLNKAIRIPEKAARYTAYAEYKKKAVEALVSDDDPNGDRKAKEIKAIFEDLKHTRVREMILQDGIRIDGRDLKSVRPIQSEVSILPRAHGSALFTRGETQALVTTTLGSGSDEQTIDDVTRAPSRKKFMLHYNFPPFSVGEVKFLRSPGRREIGHGALAERALAQVLPPVEDFPYTIRIVSETLESNGSSSMATVCGGTLSLLDAGVPIQAPVAGIAMGLIKEGKQCAILSDILGDEDHLGDMDFKVAGTERGVTAIQMDIKIAGIDREIFTQALAQAREGRVHILGKMRETMASHRPELPAHAPRMQVVKINPDKIKDLIGSGGSTIRRIVEESGAKIDIEDDGSVFIFAAEGESFDRAVRMVREVTDEPEIGRIYQGLVRRIVEFGAFVEILPKRDGLLHISELANYRVKQVTDIVKEGDRIPVKVLELDPGGKIRLSLKQALPEGQEWKGGAARPIAGDHEPHRS